MIWITVIYVVLSLGSIVFLSGKLGSTKKDLKDAKDREKSHDRAYQKLSMLISRYRSFTYNISRGRFNHIKLRDEAAELSKIPIASDVPRSSE